MKQILNDSLCCIWDTGNDKWVKWWWPSMPSPHHSKPLNFPVTGQLNFLFDRHSEAWLHHPQRKQMGPGLWAPVKAASRGTTWNATIHLNMSCLGSLHNTDFHLSKVICFPVYIFPDPTSPPVWIHFYDLCWIILTSEKATYHLYRIYTYPY